MVLVEYRGVQIRRSPFNRANIAKAVLFTYILINASVWGIVAVHFISQNGSSLFEVSPFRETFRSNGLHKKDSDVVNISGRLISWPDKVSDVEEEYIYGTDPRDPDTDKDGMEDGWEIHHMMKREWIFDFTSPDPLEKDPFDNYDGDGFDSDRNGWIEGEEALFNLREYCGGALFNIDENRFDPSEPIFGGLDPDVDWREIGMKGGYHLFDDPADGIVGDETNFDNDNLDDYRSFLPGDPGRPSIVTTDPSTSDTDMDGMDDGWEIHYARMWKLENGLEHRYPSYRPVVYGWGFTDEPIHPLKGDDAEEDIDVRPLAVYIQIADYVGETDGLTNLQEYEYGTNPFKWDSDEDSIYNGLKGELYQLDDGTEARMEYLGQNYWNLDWDCPYPWNDLRLDPMNPDTDGDGMGDGWELMSGLNPLNSSDYFKDLDNDGLPNYLEFAFPNEEELWFRTDPKNPDTDGDGILDGWEAYNAKVISITPALSTREDLEDKIPDGRRMVFSLSPMIQDAEEDNDYYYILDENGNPVTRQNDGVTNLEEYLGTIHHRVPSDPNDPDTDDDGLYDGEEMKTGFHGELFGGVYMTNSTFAGIYYPNHTRADSDCDFGGSLENNEIGNTSRTIDDWEEVNGRTKYTLPKNGLDDDGDGVIDEPEGEHLYFNPTNATNPDTDLDGWMDVDEIFGIDTGLMNQQQNFGIIRTDPTRADTDHDGLDDRYELQRLGDYKPWITDPREFDTDSDGMNDWLEETVDLFPLVDWNRGDNYPGFENAYDEYLQWYRTNYPTDMPELWKSLMNTVDRTDPLKEDTDGDGMDDGWEYRFGYVTSSKENYTLIKDHFDLNDEIYQYCMDVMPRAVEGMRFWLVNPLISGDHFDDPDRDGLTNFEEYRHRTHPLKADTDGDGMPDGWELDPRNRYEPIYDADSRKYRWTLDPLDPGDWYLDPDHDGVVIPHWARSTEEPGRYLNSSYYFPWVNLYEYRFGTDIDGDGINENTTSPAPRISYLSLIGGYDSDENGVPDGPQFFFGDPDNDTLPSGWELFYNGTLWNDPETRPYIDNGPRWSVFDHSRKFAEENLLPRDLELTSGQLYPDRNDTNMDGLGDPLEDLDLDGVSNFIEMMNGTDPTDIFSYLGSPNFMVDDSRKVH